MGGARSFSFWLLASLLMPLAGFSHEHIPVDINLEVSAGTDSNLSQADKSRDIVEDRFQLANLTLSKTFEQGMMREWVLRGFAESQRWQDTGSLDRDSVGGALDVRWVTRLGYDAAIYQLTLQVQDDNYGVGTRDSTVYRGKLFASKRINDTTTLTMGLERKYRDSDGLVFDVDDGRVFLSADYQFRDKPWALYGTLSYLEGNSFSSAQRTLCNGWDVSDIFWLVNSATAVENDTALDREYCGSWVAYRLDTQSNVVTMGVNRQLGHNLSADISFLYANVEATEPAQENIDYERNIVTASLFARF